MGTFVKGSAVPNATEYVLLERTSENEIISLGIGSQDLFTNQDCGNVGGGATISGHAFGIGRIPASKKIYGIKVAFCPLKKDDNDPAEGATTLFGYLYTAESLPLRDGQAGMPAQVSCVRVREATVDISAPYDNTAIADVIFEEPFENTDEKFLIFGYHLDSGCQRRTAKPSISGAEACGNNDGNTYSELFGIWYSTTRDYKSTESGLWSAGYDDTSSIAYTLLTEGATANAVYKEKATADSINFEVSALDFEAGDHFLVVQAHAEGYESSDYSNEVTYTVEEATE